MRHSYVVRIGRQLVDQLLVTHHGDQPGLRRGVDQAAVVEPGAPAQPVASAIDRQRGDKDHLGIGDVSGRQPRWRRLMQTELGRHQCAGLVWAPLHRHRAAVAVVAGDRKQHAHTEFRQGFQQHVRSGLGADRNVGAHRLPAAHQTGQPVAKSPRLGVSNVGRYGASGTKNAGSQLGLHRQGHTLHHFRTDTSV